MLSIVYHTFSHASLWEQVVQGLIEMVEQLKLRIWNIPINQALRLRARSDLQLLAENDTIVAILGAACKQLECQDILARRDIHFEQGEGAP